ncbi:MAG: hypothetical protein HOP02_09695 [Methylococcaceae bacterium]|nr:hypothetical protein [Methylococcaceae bacterium]
MAKQMLLFLALIIMPLSSAQADTVPYLLEQIQKAQPDADAIEKAKKQVADHQDVKLQKISLVPFHVREKNPINESKVYCTECHGALPHLKSIRSRAFLNMHTDYVACETCHFRQTTAKDGGSVAIGREPMRPNTTLHYGWYDYNQEKLITGSPELFHSGRKKDDKPWVSRDGHLKIVPLLNQEPIIATRNHPAAKALYQQWKDADKERKGALKAQYHQPLQTKGPECSACHNDLQNAVEATVHIEGKTVQKITKPPMLDYTALGATPAQQTAIRQNTIADFFGHYQPEKEDKTAVTETTTPYDPTKEERIRITNFLK